MTQCSPLIGAGAAPRVPALLARQEAAGRARDHHVEAALPQDSGAHSQIRALGDILRSQDKGKYLT